MKKLNLMKMAKRAVALTLIITSGVSHADLKQQPGMDNSFDNMLNPYRGYLTNGQAHLVDADLGGGLSEKYQASEISQAYSRITKSGNRLLIYVDRLREDFNLNATVDAVAEVSANLDANTTLTYTLPGSDVDKIARLFLGQVLTGKSRDAVLNSIISNLNLQNVPPKISDQIISQLSSELRSLPTPTPKLLVTPGAIAPASDITANINAGINVSANAKLDSVNATAQTHQDSLDLVIGVPVNFRPANERHGDNHLFLGVKEQIDTVFLSVTASASCAINVRQTGLNELTQSEIPDLQKMVNDSINCTSQTRGKESSVRWKYSVGVIGFGRVTKQGGFRVLASTKPLGTAPTPETLGEAVSKYGQAWDKNDNHDLDIKGHICTERSRFCTSMDLAVATTFGAVDRIGADLSYSTHFFNNTLQVDDHLSANIGSATEQKDFIFSHKLENGNSFHIGVGQLFFITRNPGYGDPKYDRSMSESNVQTSTLTQPLNVGSATQIDNIVSNVSGRTGFWLESFENGRGQAIRSKMVGMSMHTARNRTIDWNVTDYGTAGQGFGVQIFGDKSKGFFHIECTNLNISRADDPNGNPIRASKIGDCYLSAGKKGK